MEASQEHLDKMLSDGYVHLHEFLRDLTADQRGSEVHRRAKTFPELAGIIWETTDLIIKTVTGKIQQANTKKVLFLVGSTGSGKSTTLCFLRGDSMTLTWLGEYESLSDNNRPQNDRVISHATAESCTFLPNVEVIGDVVIIDFPGFEDTRGSAVCVGMELAFRALVRRFRPRILVMESVTNSASRYLGIDGLGARLKRLLQYKERCILGVTKYSLYVPYTRWVNLVKKIEEYDAEIARCDSVIAEQNEVVSCPPMTGEVSLDWILSFGSASSKKAVAEESRESCCKSKQEALIEIECRRAKTAEVEEILRTHTGFQGFIRFRDLEQPGEREKCWQVIRSFLDDDGWDHEPDDQLELDAKDEALFDKCFKQSLVPLLATLSTGRPPRKGEKDQEEALLSELKQEITEKQSLIHVITAHHYPMIGRCLHFPEVWPQMAVSYDQQIVAAVWDYYKLKLVWVLKDLRPVDTLDPRSQIKSLKEKERESSGWFKKFFYAPLSARPNAEKSTTKKITASSPGLLRLKEQLSALTGRVKGLFGIKTVGEFDPIDAERRWSNACQSASCQEVGQKDHWVFPMWVQELCPYLARMPVTLFALLQDTCHDVGATENIDLRAQEAANELEDLSSALTWLMKLREFTESRFDHYGPKQQKPIINPFAPKRVSQTQHSISET